MNFKTGYTSIKKINSTINTSGNKLCLKTVDSYKVLFQVGRVKLSDDHPWPSF